MPSALALSLATSAVSDGLGEHHHWIRRQLLKGKKVSLQLAVHPVLIDFSPPENTLRDANTAFILLYLSS